jgi:hypothetical protein
MFEFTPNVFEFTPNMFEFTPNVFEFTPNVFEFTPNVFEFTPNVFEFTLNVFEFTLNMFEFTPNVFEFTPVFALRICKRPFCHDAAGQKSMTIYIMVYPADFKQLFLNSSDPGFCSKGLLILFCLPGLAHFCSTIDG